MDVKIISHIRIKNHSIWINGIELKHGFNKEGFLKSIYKHLEIKYPKFYKMDELSRLGFIASELLLNNPESKKAIALVEPEDIGLILQNTDSTIDVDSSFYDSIIDNEKHFPSPALFVYTLPNITLGEVAIRNKFKGENALFIYEKYNLDLGVNYINGLFNKNRIKACLGGWFNANKGNYDAFFYLAAQTDGKQEKHTTENISKIYK